MYYSTEISSPLGMLTLASDGIGLVGLWMNGQKYFLDSLPQNPQRNDEIGVFKRTKIWLDHYFAGKKPQPDELPIAPNGSDFRRQVWKELCKIPYGSVTTYGEIANKIAQDTGLSSMSAQAVGGAVGHNPISIIIPCHRVIGVNGSLTGYAGGIDKKIRLLEIEGIDTNNLKIPYIIRAIRFEEIALLDDFLYNAIFIPEGYDKSVPRNIIYNNPNLYAAIRDFGKQPDDYCLVAEVFGKVVGAVWVRIADEYGHLDDKTPSFSISLYKEYRGRGIGTALMRRMIAHLKSKGCKKASLGVNKENYAVKMYQKVGFRIVGDGANNTEWLMIWDGK